jgi:hypothetical protein
VEPKTTTEAPPPDESQRAASDRKPYATPRLAAHGRLATVTRDTTTSGLEDNPLPSDRTLKEGFAPVDPRDILARVAALPIETWSYRGDTARHLGPMAQDFLAAFGLGVDERHIFPLDAGGVALAAIQGLLAVVQAQSTRLERLEQDVTVLRRETTALRLELAAREEAAPVA